MILGSDSILDQGTWRQDVAESLRCVQGGIKAKGIRGSSLLNAIIIGANRIPEMVEIYDTSE